MFDPITASLGYVSSAIFSAIFSGMVGNRSDALLHEQWKQFKANLQNYRPDANHDLQAAVYRAYLLATLQTCAALLEQKGLRVAAWFKLGVLPEKMANALRGLLRDAPTGVIAQGDQDWLERVARDHLEKLKRLDDEPTELPSAAAQPELDALLHQLDLLMPSLLQFLSYRLETWLRLRRWREAAADVEAVIGHFESFIEDARIHDELKQAAMRQRERMLGYLRKVDANGRESLYAELGERAERVRRLVEAKD